MQDHIDAENPHEQYVITKPVIPTVHEEDLIYVKPFGVMEWNETHSIYRSLNCCQMINGWNKKPADHGCVKADGAMYSKSGVYKGLWTAAQDYGLVVTPDKFAVGQYLFVDVGTDAFRVPDTRGYFVRNTEATGREDFSVQLDAMQTLTGRYFVRAGTKINENFEGVFGTINGGVTTLLQATSGVGVGVASPVS